MHDESVVNATRGSIKSPYYEENKTSNEGVHDAISKTIEVNWDERNQIKLPDLNSGHVTATIPGKRDSTINGATTFGRTSKNMTQTRVPSRVESRLSNSSSRELHTNMRRAEQYRAGNAYTHGRAERSSQMRASYTKGFE